MPRVVDVDVSDNVFDASTNEGTRVSPNSLPIGRPVTSRAC